MVQSTLCKNGIGLYLLMTDKVGKKYVITKLGKEIAYKEIKRLQNLISIAEEIMGGQI